MKAFLLQFAAILVISNISQLLFPWWSLVVVAAIVGLWFKHQVRSFLAGFFAIGLSWFGYALWLSNSESGQLLANKIGTLLGEISGFSLVLVTALIGAVLGGLGAWTGTAGRRIFD